MRHTHTLSFSSQAVVRRPGTDHKSENNRKHYGYVLNSLEELTLKYSKMGYVYIQISRNNLCDLKSRQWVWTYCESIPKTLKGTFVIKKKCLQSARELASALPALTARGAARTRCSTASGRWCSRRTASGGSSQQRRHSALSPWTNIISNWHSLCSYSFFLCLCKFDS